MRARGPRVLSREDLFEVLEENGWGELARTDEDIAEAIAIDRLSKVLNARRIVESPPEGWCYRCGREWRTRAKRRPRCSRCKTDRNCLLIRGARFIAPGQT